MASGEAQPGEHHAQDQRKAYHSHRDIDDPDY
jgi:hypothetical protein